LSAANTDLTAVLNIVRRCPSRVCVHTVWNTAAKFGILIIFRNGMFTQGQLKPKPARGWTTRGHFMLSKPVMNAKRKKNTAFLWFAGGLAFGTPFDVEQPSMAQ